MPTVETETPLQSALAKLALQPDRTAFASGRKCVFCLGSITPQEKFREIHNPFRGMFGHASCCEIYRAGGA